MRQIGKYLVRGGIITLVGFFVFGLGLDLLGNILDCNSSPGLLSSQQGVVCDTVNGLFELGSILSIFLPFLLFPLILIGALLLLLTKENKLDDKIIVKQSNHKYRQIILWFILIFLLFYLILIINS